jgi:hypothetical protein
MFQMLLHGLVFRKVDCTTNTLIELPCLFSELFIDVLSTARRRKKVLKITVNGELESTWKERVVAYFKIISQML